ncbi:odorant receptor 131-2-like [Astyanax mexicanus]|uniref:odorant receptor 131-2-like n=1 Tax=Astyanax mexicanus TaxID=7994 RepID=UPI0020CAA60B|nr:odorant receptor 131-2-like [Astyanax mexicanus]XP_049322535.1 odorant receptor 131-2-like [Astyanax mexicanus]
MADTNGSSGDAFVYQSFIEGQMSWIAFIKLSVLIVVTLFAVYVNCVILYVLNSKPVFKETSRYILFAHMLFNDTVHLILTFFLFFFAVLFLKLAKAVCSMILFFDSTTFYIAPLNLAVMSLERYVAICFPLRHTEIATQKRTGIAIIFIWLIGCVNILMNIITAIVLDPNFFSVSMFCAYEQLYLQLWQPEVISWLNAFLFASVTLIIVFTYISIMITARSVSSKKDSAKKAHKTVLLHLIQLGLCTMSFLYAIVDRALYVVTGSGTSLYLHVQYVNFLLLLILPRCLSPLIYGLRDDAIRPLFKHYFCPCFRKFSTAVNAQ